MVGWDLNSATLKHYDNVFFSFCNTYGELECVDVAVQCEPCLSVSIVFCYKFFVCVSV